MPIEWEWKKVQNLEYSKNLERSGKYVEVGVNTNYGAVEEYQSISYEFTDADPELVSDLELFRSEQDIPCIIGDFGDYQLSRYFVITMIELKLKRFQRIFLRE